MNKEQKEKEIALLKDKLSRSKTVLVSDHTGLNVAEITVLRKKLKDADSELRISKNTLLTKAVDGTDLEPLKEHFRGPTSIVFGYDDPSVPAKIIYDSIKEIEKPVFKSYFYEGKQHDYNTLKRIAELPSREVVLAILISTLEGPIAEFIGTIEGASREFIGTLDALVKSKS